MAHCSCWAWLEEHPNFWHNDLVPVSLQLFPFIFPCGTLHIEQTELFASFWISHALSWRMMFPLPLTALTFITWENPTSSSGSGSAEVSFSLGSPLCFHLSPTSKRDGRPLHELLGHLFNSFMDSALFNSFMDSVMSSVFPCRWKVPQGWGLHRNTSLCTHTQSGPWPMHRCYQQISLMTGLGEENISSSGDAAKGCHLQMQRKPPRFPLSLLLSMVRWLKLILIAQPLTDASCLTYQHDSSYCLCLDKCLEKKTTSYDHPHLLVLLSLLIPLFQTLLVTLNTIYCQKLYSATVFCLAA